MQDFLRIKRHEFSKNQKLNYENLTLLINLNNIHLRKNLLDIEQLFHGLTKLY